MINNKFSIVIVFLTIAILGSSCGSLMSSPPRNAEIIEVAASTSLQTWLDEAVGQFNRERYKSPSSKPYYVEITYVDAGQAIIQHSENGFNPNIWIPDTFVWVELLADEGNPAFMENCQSIAKSPLVIAMWQPVAEALGWPGRELGWLDIGSLAADPSAWEYYSGGQFGSSLRIGHAHPGLSPSGTSTLLAVIQAAESKQTAVGVSEIEHPIVQASITAFESAVSMFSKSTKELGLIMEDRGAGYLGAAVVYENIVFEYIDQEPAIVPIYPLEGTFMADFPACLNETSTQAKQQGGMEFRNFLLGEIGEQLANQSGLRTAHGSLPEKSFLQPDQPEIIFEETTADVVYAIQGLWDSSRKPVNLVMLIDTSGSMQGIKIDQVRKAAVEFIETMGDSDYISIVTFGQNQQGVSLIEHARMETSRNQVINLIRSLTANGATPLFDSIGLSAEIIARSNSSQTSNTLVVLTDGMDTSSYRFRFDKNLTDLAMGNNTSIFTIAFGNDADEQILRDLATMTNGNFYLGDQTNISDIYQEMSVIFGGSVGIGR